MKSPATCIETITNALREKPIVRALFLGGSRGAGLEDAYSDIDFLAVAMGGPSDEFAGLWRKAVSQTGEIVLWWDREAKPMLINAITHDWQRIDVEIVTPEAMARRNLGGLKTLFDHDRISESLPALPQANAPNTRRMKWQFEEFIRILGLLPLAMGREEYINSVTGAFYLRNLLVDLLIEETAAPYRGGALHLNRLITDEQKALLTSLPPLLPTRDAMMAAYPAYASAYLPRARAMALSLGIDWPEHFEAATWAHLRKSLGIERLVSR
jgi:hypothetical protein